MSLEKSVQHTVMALIQEVRERESERERRGMRGGGWVYLTLLLVMS